MTSRFHGFRMLGIAVLLPAAVTIASVIILLRLAATGPAEVATHWQFVGPPDGFGSPYMYPILMASVSVALIAVLGGGSVLAAHRGPVTRVIKLIAVTSTWVSLFLGIAFIGSLADQRTAASVPHAAAPGPLLLVDAAIAIAVAVGAWFVLPKAVYATADANAPAVQPVLLTDSERASWHRTATASRGATWALIGATVVVGAAEILVVFASNGRTWWLAFLPILLMLIVLATLTWSVRVDGRGVRLRSAIGLPVISIPLANIASASVVTVRALSEYGGWGVRFNLSGRIGVILRSGEALEIQRKKGLIVVVTVDDATTAAALINGLVQRKVAGR